MNYKEFLQNKKFNLANAGFDVNESELNPMLFDFQKAIVKWSLKRGKSAIFADCGLGKTPMQLEWANQVHKKTGGKILIVAPLAVSLQTKREGKKFGVNVNVAKTDEDIINGINITNYEKLDKFDCTQFDGIVLDESSILKSFTGKTTQSLLAKFEKTKYKLACTATPSPNDYTELGNHCEFLNVMGRNEMLSMFFINDASNVGDWRLKKHAESEFWQFVGSWAVMLATPDDLGFDGSKFILPEKTVHNVILEDKSENKETLFSMPAAGMSEVRKSQKESLEERCKKTAELIRSKPDEQWLIWCQFNDEGNLLEKLIPNCINVSGSDTDEYKVQAIEWFIGNKCICNSNLFRGKLARWKKNHSHIGKNIIEKIVINAYENQLNMRKNTKSAEENIIKNIISKIKNDLENSVQNIELKCGMLNDEKDIKLIRNLERNVKDQLEKLQKEILKLNLIKDLKNTELHLLNIIKCAKIKKINVQFVENQMEKIDYSSIIATQKEISEDCYVLNVTLDSEILMIIQNYWNEQFCICGHKSGERNIVSKAKMFGFGLNLQNCHNMIFCGISFSYEGYYQSIRRCWRFGQKEKVDIYVVINERELSTIETIESKEKKHEEMSSQIINSVKTFFNFKQTKNIYMEDIQKHDRFTAILGDSVEKIKSIKDNSIDFMIYSPPFSDLYTYSNSDRDMGNSKNDQEFYKHFEFLAKDLFRTLKEGRNMSVHCMNLSYKKFKDGFIGMKDFRGDLIRIFQKAGFIFHAEVTIWKDPVVQMQRTKALTLLHKQVKKDSARSAQGYAEYLLTFKKPGENKEPITHTADDFPVEIWQKYASPVWMDINVSETLQKKSAREDKDEKHICPLQLDVIRRAVYLWSNPGDIVLSPFMGIGSEGYVSLECGRNFIGIELKKSYYDQAVLNLERACNIKQQLTIPL